MATHAHITPAPMSAPPIMSRRWLMSAAATATLTGTALASVEPVAALAGSTGADAEILRFSAEFEAVIRRYNSLWRWQVPGQRGCLQGADYIEDDDEREVAVDAVEEPLPDLVDDMLEHPPTTLAGCQALARCLVLSAGDVRDVVSGEKEGFENLGLTHNEWGLLVSLLRGLTGGALTDANCMDAPAKFVPDAAGAA